MTLFEILIVVVSALLSTLLGLLYFGKPTKNDLENLQSYSSADISLLFKEETLQHASTAGFRLAQFIGEVSDWAALRISLAHRFPSFPSRPSDNANTVVIPSQHDTDIAKLEIRKIDDATHVQIIDQETLPLDVQHKIKSLEAEVMVTGFAGTTAPHPIWQVKRDGTIGWYNTAYETLYKIVFDKEPHADQPLFDIEAQSTDPLRSNRTSVSSGPDGKHLWYDISQVACEVGAMFHAIDINAVIDAEIAQRNFVQTLAKTFAHLSTGLAIFDRNGQLALFNPALVDLSQLPREFLSTRPDLLSFFDRLRDNQVMPEPKNYHSWREELSDVIKAATDGSYQETWSLVSGQTYRVSGRPHPDGAIAFLIEDISAEISLARSFRAELAIGQSMMNTFNMGMVVFSATGVLQFCNKPYREMWTFDPESAFIDVTILDALKDWQRQSQPNSAWADIRDFVMKIGPQSPWECEMKWKNGDVFSCSIKPVALGATMLVFKTKPAITHSTPEKSPELQE